eukprot:9501043-Lingulodinium_polyedra.AAC.1
MFGRCKEVEWRLFTRRQFDASAANPASTHVVSRLIGRAYLQRNGLVLLLPPRVPAGFARSDPYVGSPRT